MDDDSRLELNGTVHDTEKSVPEESSVPDDVLSLNGQNVCFSGKTIQFDFLARQESESEDQENEEHEEESDLGQDTGQESIPFLNAVSEKDSLEEDENSDGESNDELIPISSDDKPSSDDEPLSESIDIRPFATEFSDDVSGDGPRFDEQFAAGLSSLFEADEADDFGEDRTLDSEIQSPEEQYQEEETQRLREHLDGVIRQSDEDALYELGEKFGAASFVISEEGYSPDLCPRSILEAMLFVGDRNNRPLSLKRALPLMRNVSEQEARDAIDELNTRYDSAHAPYRIVEEKEGFRMVLRDEFNTVRERFAGKTRQFKLSQKTIDILALIAYRQPVSAKEILEYRPGCNAQLTLLVKRNLIEEEKRTAESKTIVYFRTTKRFLDIFHLGSLDDLPIVDEVDYR